MTKELISKRYLELAHAMEFISVVQHPNGFDEVNMLDWNHWATSALNLVNISFAADSIHFKQLTKAIDSSEKHGLAFAVDSAKGSFIAARADFEGGYFSTLAQGIAGEVFGSLLDLASAALKEGHKDSAAVLASAAFEDSLKKIGSLHGLSVEQGDLGNVIGALKAKQLLQGGAAKLAERYQNFRNWAMHANWEKITQEEVGGLIGFVEQLLVKHLS
jgi:uncharacterized protein DUF4145